MKMSSAVWCKALWLLFLTMKVSHFSSFHIDSTELAEESSHFKHDAVSGKKFYKCL